MTDFGIAKLLEPGMQRTTHLAGATVGYAPPEQFEKGNLRVGRPTDVFSLAAIFYETVTGAPAFNVPANAHPFFVLARQLEDAPPAFGRTPQRLPPELAGRPDVVAAVDAELARAFAPEPSVRHPTVTFFFEALERALAALGSTPSIPSNRPAGRLIIRPSHRVPTDPALDSTVHAQMGQGPAHGATLGMGAAPAPGRDIGRAEALVWKRVTDPLASGMPRAIAVAPRGDRAVAFGSRGALQWTGGPWSPFEMPSGLVASATRMATWWGDRLFFANANGVVQSFEPGLRPLAWPVHAVALRGIFADASGVVLAGERPTSGGPMGVVVEIPAGSPGGAPRLTDVPGTGALRAAIRFAGGILACSEAGALALVRAAPEPARVVQACAAPLTALTATADGMAVTLGGGGYAFRVSPALDVQLEAVQTTRDLYVVSRGADGTIWCGGDAGRVLRRGPAGWMRVGIEGAQARVLALHAAPQSLLAFCDDGSVFEGIAMPRPGEWRPWTRP